MAETITSRDVTAWLAGRAGDKAVLIEADLLKQDSLVREYLDWMSGEDRTKTPRLVRESLKSLNLSIKKPLAEPASARIAQPSTLEITSRLLTKIRDRFETTGLRVSVRRSVYVGSIIFTLLVSAAVFTSSAQKATIANDIARLETAYPVLDVVAPNLQPVHLMSLATRQIISSHLQQVFDAVIGIKSTSQTISLAKGKAFLGRARLLHAQMGRSGDQAALSDLAAAEEYFGRLPRSDIRDLSLADVALNQSTIMGYQGKFRDGINFVQSIIPTIDNFVRQNPARSDAQLRLALLLSNRATSLRGLALSPEITNEKDAYKMLDGAESDYIHAIGIVEGLIKSKKYDETIEEWLSRLNGNLGLLLIDQSGNQRPEAAVEAVKRIERAVQIADDLRKRFPYSLSIADAQVAATLNLGDVRYTVKDLLGAKSTYASAINLYDDLEAKNPGSREFVWGQASSRRSLGRVLLALGEKADAVKLLNDSLGRYDQLIKDYPLVREIANERNDLVGLLKIAQ